MPRWFFKNLISILVLISLISCSPPYTQPSKTYGYTLPATTTEAASTVLVTDYLGQPVEVVDAPRLSVAEKRARAAAVKVRPLLGSGHGSGTYMYMFGRRVVVTAAHVVGAATVMIVEGRDGETVTGRLVLCDPVTDLAFLVVPEMETRTAVPYRPQSTYDERLVGARITYTGFPSHHDLLTIRGYVAALERGYIITNMFGWFGSSGSGVYDKAGRFLGVVSAIDVGTFLIPLPLDSIVWVAPISSIDQDLLEARVRTADPAMATKAFPGAAAPRRGGTQP